ncbi:MAG: beta-ketoacyl-ACP synthase II [Dehalococcoidia bacterium]
MGTTNRDGRRVVITGMGSITPLGNSVEEFWQGCVEGRSGIDHLTLFDASKYPVRIAGEIKEFDPQKYMDYKEARRMARFSQFAVAAARQAIEDAGLKVEGEDATRIGVVLGNGIGGLPEIEQGDRTVLSKGGMRLDPLWFPKVLPNMAAAQVSLTFGLKGYNGTMVTACAAATQAMGEAAELIRRGRADVMVAGGAEGGISELGLSGFAVMRAMSTQNADPQKASRPFDAKRDGFVAADGAAAFVFESLEHAQARGAPILCEVVGYAATADAYHLVAPCADGDGAARCMAGALADAGLGPEEVNYINAHGTSTPLNDVAETVAIKRVFGERAYQVPISATKSMIGHALGGAGALESIACIKTILSGIIHPTINYEYPDPECDLDYVPNVARRAEVTVVLKNSFGFGGQNACLVFKRFEG